MARLIDADILLKKVHDRYLGAQMAPDQSATVDWFIELIDALVASRGTEIERQQKMFAELEYQCNKEHSENKMLKECIVRMALGRYGVLNE